MRSALRQARRPSFLGIRSSQRPKPSSLQGLVPQFVDVDVCSGLIDLASCQERLSDRTQVAIPVHLYGRMADMDELKYLPTDTAWQ